MSRRIDAHHFVANLTTRRYGARLRILGAPYLDISEELAVLQVRVEKLWKQARRKLG